ncbi:MAG TPA: hypothetical protein VEP90_09020 [Methylomirabilota bacterium]|nr:hypothetical protein [Methylomirabilota bacterium]
MAVTKQAVVLETIELDFEEESDYTRLEGESVGGEWEYRYQPMPYNEIDTDHIEYLLHGWYTH